MAPANEFAAALAHLGVAKDAGVEQIAIQSLVSASLSLQDVTAARVGRGSGAGLDAANRMFDAAAHKLDAAKASMLDVVKQAPSTDRRVLMLDSIDTVEFAHGQPRATTLLGATMETLTSDEPFAAALQKALGLDDGAFTAASRTANSASEWAHLDEMVTPAERALAHAGDEPVASQTSAELGRALGLVDDAGAAALANKGSAGHLLALGRVLSSLWTKTEKGGRELDKGEIDDVLERRAGAGDLSRPLVDALRPLLGELVSALRNDR
ncbi:MAG TPA: hypothetical protein VGO62_06165, partial [Myxococcota bacterium]